MLFNLFVINNQNSAGFKDVHYFEKKFMQKNKSENWIIIRYLIQISSVFSEYCLAFLNVTYFLRDYIYQGSILIKLLSLIKFWINEIFFIIENRFLSYIISWLWFSLSQLLQDFFHLPSHQNQHRFCFSLENIQTFKE